MVRVRARARARARVRVKVRARVRIWVRLGVGVRARIRFRDRVIETSRSTLGIVTCLLTDLPTYLLTYLLTYLGIVAEDGGFEEMDLRALLTQLRVQRAQLVVELHEGALGSTLLLSELGAPPPAHGAPG